MELSQLIQLLPSWSWKEKVAYLAWKLREKGGTGEMPVRHLFEEGRYIREMIIPAEFLFIGRVHKVGHLVQLLKGEVQLIFPDRSERRVAPDEMHTVPGFQTVFFTLTPVIGRTVHPNDDGLRNIDVLEDEIFERPEGVLALGERLSQEMLA
jgi:hypothetical protein